ncbi:MAG: hypothetical protein FWE27_04615 [Defluviitaleaceae bacterium]|nr:hypothetical protein [Defluviitaleaceae bacterium]
MRKMIFILLIAFLPTVSAFAAVDAFTATFTASLEDENGAVILNDEDASITFSLGEQTIIFMRFDDPTRFTSDYASIDTNLPVISNMDAQSTGAQLLSFMIDGDYFSSEGIPIISPVPTLETRGYLSLDLNLLELTNAEHFTTLEIQFLVNNASTGVEDPPDEPDVAIIEIGEPPEPIETADEVSGRRTGLPMGAVIGVIVAIFIPIFVMNQTKKRINRDN